MKLLIIGHSVVDHVYEGESSKISPGGIFYSAAGFNSVKNENDELFLLTSRSETDEKLFTPLYENFNMKFAAYFKSIPHVNLFITGNTERGEHYERFIEPLKIPQQIDLKSFDGIYINMITGNDLTPEQFQVIRNNYDGKIYLDVHTLSRGVGKEHHRFFRKITNYESYIGNIDIVQVNENELLTITPYDQIEKIKEEVFKLGVRLLIITKGSRGVEAFSNDGRNFYLDGLKVKSVNKIGCGDVFGSVFFYHYIKKQNIEKSLSTANKAAGLTTTYSDSNELINFKNDIIKGHIEN